MIQPALRLNVFSGLVSHGLCHDPFAILDITPTYMDALPVILLDLVLNDGYNATSKLNVWRSTL